MRKLAFLTIAIVVVVALLMVYGPAAWGELPPRLPASAGGPSSARTAIPPQAGASSSGGQATAVKVAPRAAPASIPGGEGSGFAPDERRGEKDWRLPIHLQLAKEGVDAQGRWIQTLRVTLEPGGNLFYAGLALYGEEGHTKDVVQLIRGQQGTVDPQQLPTGFSFEVTVDPTRTYIIGLSSLDADGTKTRVYFNGVREVIYPGGRSVRREVEFPTVAQAKAFQKQEGDQVQSFPAGSKLVRYQYLPQQDIRPVLRQIYGVDSVRALRDFVRQTHWQVNAPDPPTGQVYEFVVDTASSYADPPTLEMDWLPGDPPIQQKLSDLAKDRLSAGIHLVSVGSHYNTYQVGVMDPSLTARDVARLIYGREDQFPRIVQAAGLQPQPEFNPRLFGAVFELSVDLADEYFAWKETAPDPKGMRTVTLLNGTEIRGYGRHEIVLRLSGLRNVIRYPSGQTRVVYRPSSFTLSVLNSLAIVDQIIADRSLPPWSGEQQLGQRLRALQDRSQDLLPALVWQWDRAVPRDLGGPVESVGWYGHPAEHTIEVLLAPAEAAGGATERWSELPSFVKVLGASAIAGVVFGIGLAIFFARHGRLHPFA